WQALGPCGREVVAYLALLPTLTDDQVQIAARYAAWSAAWSAARDAAWAVVVRDMISTPHFATLTEPMRAAGIDFAALGGAS
ncbi:hypothetical protein ACXWQ2_09240, partial [Streptococcus pyogenes]